MRKTKRNAKFDGLEPRHYEDIKEIMAPERGSKSYGTFEKKVMGLLKNRSLIKLIMMRATLIWHFCTLTYTCSGG